MNTYIEDNNHDDAKTNFKRISDYTWMSLFKDRPNINFYNEGPEIVPLISLEERMKEVISKKTKEPKLSSLSSKNTKIQSQSLSQKQQTLQLKLEL